MNPEQNQETVKPFLGLEGSNLHLFVSRCCNAALSVEPLCRICCGQCGKPEPDPKLLSEQNQETRGKWKYISGQTIPNTIWPTELTVSNGIKSFILRVSRPEDADEIRDALNSQSQWIRVEDRLPEWGGYYAVYAPKFKANPMACWFHASDKFWSEDWPIEMWAELPTPPKD